MKILQINCVYPLGSTGKIVHEIHKELLRRSEQSIVCYGRGKYLQEQYIYKTCGELYSKCNNLLSRFTGIMHGGCFFSTRNLISIIQKENPDIVHLHCINGYFVNIYYLITWLKNNHVKTVLTLHAEFMFTGNCGHALECNQWLHGCGHCPRLYDATKSLFIDNTHKSWEKMYQAFRGFDQNLVVTSVSPWLMERAKQSPVLRDKRHCVIYNGVDINTFRYRSNQSILAKYHIPHGKKICFCPTAYFSFDENHLKGGYYVYQLAQLMQHDDVLFVVAGNHDKDIYKQKNLLFLGYISNQMDLAALYAISDVTLLTSKRETFSMVCAESLCCGTPVVGFEAGGPEQIAISEYSYFVQYKDIKQMISCINMVFRSGISHEKISNIAMSIYGINKMTSEYIKLYQEIMEN